MRVPIAVFACPEDPEELEDPEEAESEETDAEEEAEEAVNPDSLGMLEHALRAGTSSIHPSVEVGWDGGATLENVFSLAQGLFRRKEQAFQAGRGHF